ncbi:UDP-N-acetylmuramate--L-alanine ligase [Pelagibacteraceae bacterium]|jgi:UDP-N-acetylmuramate--alanine ligase|nr:UDP-N-acetylmuramate--L-alanine ligase [Pelagibacteraceae bacterium]
MLINKKDTIHIIGIGGIGMSGIAEIMSEMGFRVQGSDVSRNNNIDRLTRKKIKVFIGHKASNVNKTNIVFFSTAIKDNNIEILTAQKNNIPTLPRFKILSHLMRLKKGIAISGSHGKTTTTTMVSSILMSQNLKPTIINGGIINEIGTNTKLGSGDWMVVEADESDGTFLKLPATISVVTNIDKEHLDFYKNFSDLQKSFKKFINQVPFYGFSVVCNDDLYLRKMMKEITATQIVTYGFSKDSDIRAINIRIKNECVIFDVENNLKKDDKKIIKNYELPMLGSYNILNSLVGIAISLKLKLPQRLTKIALKNFNGVSRRFTKIGSFKNNIFIDDYAHHPTEIENVLSAAKQSKLSNNVIAVFQPHRYSRVESLQNDFSKCFKKADTVLVMDVYAAGEKNVNSFKIEKLTKLIKKNSNVKTYYVKSLDLLSNFLNKDKKNLVIFMGAGDISNKAISLVSKLRDGI